MVPDTPDVATALELLGLTVVPKDFEELACQVAWTHPAAVAMSDAQSLAYRVVWVAVEERIESRTGGDPWQADRPNRPRSGFVLRSGLGIAPYVN